MPSLTAEEQDTFLDERGVLMRIGTVRADGRPLVTPIWFLHEDDALWFTPRERSEWFTNLRRDPRVCLAIDEQNMPYRKVLVEGDAELVYDIGDDNAWRDLYRRIAGRYIDAEAAEAYIQTTIDEPRGLYRVPLARARVRSWRMPVTGEDPTGIWHRRYYRTATEPQTKAGS